MSAKSEYRDIWDLVDRMIKAALMDPELEELPANRREEWHRKLESVTKDMEQEIIMKRLSQEETHEREERVQGYLGPG